MGNAAELRSERLNEYLHYFEAIPVAEAPEVDYIREGICNQTDPESFFPEIGMSSADAKVVCGGCIGIVACRESKIAEHERFGVWGGLTKQERDHVALLREAGEDETVVNDYLLHIYAQVESKRTTWRHHNGLRLKSVLEQAS
jgi:WhiB family redox-sensing transcriptional regulator